LTEGDRASSRRVRPAQILTSDPEDIRAYTATLDHADIITEAI
jgi:hypothetical protein